MGGTIGRMARQLISGVQRLFIGGTVAEQQNEIRRDYNMECAS